MNKHQLMFNCFKSKLKSDFDEGINCFLKLHHDLFPSDENNTYEDYIWHNTTIPMFSTTIKNEKTIGYYLYHLTRIEDITANVLIANNEEIFFKENYQHRLNSIITTTGNELKDNEIVVFSNQLNYDELRKYRMEVGKATEAIVKSLNSFDLKRKFSKKTLDKIFESGSVSLDPSASWLVDYWGKKTVEGLLLMPLSRHHLVHLHACYRILKKLLK